MRPSRGEIYFAQHSEFLFDPVLLKDSLCMISTAQHVNLAIWSPLQQPAGWRQYHGVYLLLYIINICHLPSLMTSGQSGQLWLLLLLLSLQRLRLCQQRRWGPSWYKLISQLPKFTISRTLLLAELKFLHYSEPGLTSPDCDGDKTLRRHPRQTERRERGAVSSPPTPGTDPVPPSQASHAAYIRTLTERLSYDFWTLEERQSFDFWDSLTIFEL